MSTQVDPWLRGALPGISALLQPAAHAFVLADEDVAQSLAGLTDEDLWSQPGGITPLGFHVIHMAGATDRLMTYARGEALSDTQKAAAGAEKGLTTTRPAVAAAAEIWRGAYDRAMAQLRATADTELARPIAIGRAQLPSTAIGAIFHAAEHAARHAGQIVTTAKVLRGLKSGAA
jgi:hypothetical protein